MLIVIILVIHLRVVHAVMYNEHKIQMLPPLGGIRVITKRKKQKARSTSEISGRPTSSPSLLHQIQPLAKSFEERNL